MDSKIKLFKQSLVVLALMVGAIMVFSALPVAAASSGIAQPGDNVVSGLTGGATSLRELAIRMVNYFLGFLGLVAVIMIIYGGVTYVISAGNDEAVGNAKKIIMYALVGIIIVLLSFVLVNAVIGAGTGTEG